MENKDIIEHLNQIENALDEVRKTDTGTGGYLEDLCTEVLGSVITLKNHFQE